MNLSGVIVLYFRLMITRKVTRRGLEFNSRGLSVWGGSHASNKIA